MTWKTTSRSWTHHLVRIVAVLWIALQSGISQQPEAARGSEARSRRRTETTHQVDPYGGIAAAVTKPTGRFRLVPVKGRTILVTPHGRPFVALGVNHIGVLAQQRRKIDWKQVLQQYRQWGCTTVGGGGVPRMSKSMPFIASRNIVRTSKYYTARHGKNPYDYADVFDPQHQEEFRQEVKKFCSAHRNDPLLVGYCWTDTPCWDIVRTRALRGTDWVSEIRALGRESPGKQRYVQFLRGRYDDDIRRFSQAFSKPYVIGYMRCQYIDVPDTRRGALKQGLLREDGTPYKQATAAFRDANHEIIRQLRLTLEEP